jgi:hypothetical protein
MNPKLELEGEAVVTVDERGKKEIHVVFPVLFEMPGNQTSGTLEFDYHLTMTRDPETLKWLFEVGVSDETHLSDFDCKNSDEKYCINIQSFLKYELHKVVFKLKDLENPTDTFNLPIASRQLLGLTGYLNDF